MAYTVKEVSRLSGVSVRTLHYYDGIDLLKPSYVGENGYRYYDEQQLLRLQQIMFYREMDMPLKQIREALDQEQELGTLKLLRQHRQRLLNKAHHLHNLIYTIDYTIAHLEGDAQMPPEKLYEGFDKEKQEKYEQDIIARYGEDSTDLILESKEKMQQWSKQDYLDSQQELEKINKQMTEILEAGHSPESEQTQTAIRTHFNFIRRFYTPTKEVYSGLGDLYVEHPDFRKLYDSYHPQLAEFFRDAMKVFADQELRDS